MNLVCKIFNNYKKTLVVVMVILFGIIIYGNIDLSEKSNSVKFDKPRNVEYLTRGGYAVKVDKGVYLSWRLLGNEPINQRFDIYKNGKLFISNLDSTNYFDKKGNIKDVYNVVLKGLKPVKNENIAVFKNNYSDIKLDKPKDGVTPDGEKYSYMIYDVSVGDVDGDGIYEYFILWNPTNKRDNGFPGYSGNAFLDCYKVSGKKLWRIDMGINIRAGAHYTPFIVYDFTGNGRSDVVMRTTLGTKDSAGNFVSDVGAKFDGKDLLFTDSETGKKYANHSDLREKNADLKGKIVHGPDWITMFDGKTGRALQTVNFYPQRGNSQSWGDERKQSGNRSERFLAGVAYLDGVHPSIIMSRGYYRKAAMAAYDWDGKNFKLLWKRYDDFRGETLYGNGNHQLSVCDADNDGKDEIVFGATVVDNDGSILNSTEHGHGDTLHVTDFDNDGEQEIFQVHEEAPYYFSYGADMRKAKNGKIIGAIPADRDIGRGVAGNIDDSINSSVMFTTIDKYLYNMKGKRVGLVPPGNPAFIIWWDGDLSREIVFRTKISKYSIRRHKYKTIESFENVLHMERDAPIFQADILGDWREEIAYATKDNSALRIYFTTFKTKYKMPTLLHDTQYRTAVAFQNSGYNQPPHPKFFIGKRALDKWNKKYLKPATGYDYVYIIKSTSK